MYLRVVVCQWFVPVRAERHRQAEGSRLRDVRAVWIGYRVSVRVHLCV